MSRSVSRDRAALRPVPVEPPSTLLQLPAQRRPQCDRCGSLRVTRLAMTLTDGTPVAFTSCRDCEHRVWAAATDGLGQGTASGAPMPVDEVLQRTRKERAAS